MRDLGFQGSYCFPGAGDGLQFVKVRGAKLVGAGVAVRALWVQLGNFMVSLLRPRACGLLGSFAFCGNAV